MRITLTSIAAAVLMVSAGAAFATEMPRSFDQVAAAEHCKKFAQTHSDGRPKASLQQAVYDGNGNKVGTKPVYSTVRSGGKVVGYNPACGGG